MRAVLVQLILCICVASLTHALQENPEDNLPLPAEQSAEIAKAAANQTIPKRTSGVGMLSSKKVIPGVCYSPFHNKEYPLNGGKPGDIYGAIKKDFQLMKKYYGVVRTYYSSYFGVQVAPIAHEMKVKLYLGVYMTRDDWWKSQYDHAVEAVNKYPDTISAIIVGNENVPPVGPYTPDEVKEKVKYLKSRVPSSVKVGTVQRSTDWLEPRDGAGMDRLARECDIIGVNIYPFFDPNYVRSKPLALLDGVWNKMTAKYPEDKIRLTEIGWPTSGSPPSWAKKNKPSKSESKHFYNAFKSWKPNHGGGEAFWFMFFDRRSDDNTMSETLEKHFGFFKPDRKEKDRSNYPVRRSTNTQSVGELNAPGVSVTVMPLDEFGFPLLDEAEEFLSAAEAVIAPPSDTCLPRKVFI